MNSIIVGAGISGLAAALEIGDALVIERLHRHGGTSYVFTRKGYNFPTGPLGLSYPQVLRRFFQRHGLGDIEFRRKSYKLVAGDIKVCLSQPLKKLSAQLQRMYPGEKVGKAVDELLKVILGIRGVFKWNDKIFNLFGGGYAEPENITAREFFSAYIEEEELVNLLASQSLEGDSRSLTASAIMWDVMSETGIYYPEGGFKEVMDRLFYRVKDRVLLGTEVREVQTYGDGFRVVTTGGEFRAFNVVVAADCHKIEGVSCPDLNLSSSAFTLYLGGNFGISDEEHIIYYPSRDENAEHLRGNPFYSSEVEICIMSGREVSPKGGQIAVIRVPAKYDDFVLKSEEEYYDLKHRLAISLREIAENFFPGFKRAEVMEVATPISYEFWGGRYRGAVAGYSWGGKIPECLVNTEFQGLYRAGLYSFTIPFLGAFTTSLLSGVMAAGGSYQKLLAEEVGGRNHTD